MQVEQGKTKETSLFTVSNVGTSQLSFEVSDYTFKGYLLSLNKLYLSSGVTNIITYFDTSENNKILMVTTSSNTQFKTVNNFAGVIQNYNSDILKEMLYTSDEQITIENKYNSSWEKSQLIIKQFPQNMFDENKIIRYGSSVNIPYDTLSTHNIIQDHLSMLDVSFLKWEELKDKNSFKVIYGKDYSVKYDNHYTYLPLQSNSEVSKNKTVYQIFNGNQDELNTVTVLIDEFNNIKDLLKKTVKAFTDSFLQTPPILRLSVLGSNKKDTFMNLEDYVVTGLDFDMSNNFFCYNHKDYVKKFEKIINKKQLDEFNSDDWNLLIPNNIKVSVVLSPIMTHPYEVIAKKYFNLDVIDSTKNVEREDGTFNMITILKDTINDWVSTVPVFKIFENDAYYPELNDKFAEKLMLVDTTLNDIYDYSKNSNKKLHIIGKRNANKPKNTLGGSPYSLHYIERAIDLRFDDKYNETDDYIKTKGFETLEDDYIITHLKKEGARKWHIFLRVPSESIKMESDYVKEALHGVYTQDDYSKFSKSDVISSGRATGIDDKIRYIDLTQIFLDNNITNINRIEVTPTTAKNFQHNSEWWHFQYVEGLNIGDKFLPLLEQAETNLSETTENYNNFWGNPMIMNNVKFNGSSFN